MKRRTALNKTKRGLLRHRSETVRLGFAWCIILCCAACSEALPDAPQEDSTSAPTQSRAAQSDVPIALDGKAKLKAMDANFAADSNSLPVLEKVVQVGAAEIHYLEAGPRLGVPVVFMHGSRFQAETWRELGTLQLLAAQGLRAIAFDLPGGEGKSPAADFSIEQLVNQFCAALALQRPILVTPSMSGRLALPAITRNPDRFRAWVPIAPAGMEAFLEPLSDLAIPTLIVWGELDRVFPVEGARELASRLLRSETLILKGASHTCYLEQPESFHERLLTFLSELE